MRTALRLPPSLPDDATSSRLDDSDDDFESAIRDSNDGYIPDDYMSDDELLRLEAIQSIANGATRASWAPRLGVTPERVGQLVRDHKAKGRDALVRYGSRLLGGSNFHPEIKKVAWQKLKAVPTMTAQELADDADMDAVCDLILGYLPSNRRFKTLIADIARANPAVGKPLTSKGQATDAEASGYTAHWNRPGYVEYDEETTNLAAQLLAKLPFTRRPHALQARDIASKVPVGHLVSSQHMDQNDLRLLYLRIMRSKDALVARAKCKNQWPIAILPFMLRGDNAWINYALMFLMTLPELGILVEFAPAKQPKGKPVIESGIGQGQKISQNRQPNSTKGDPRLRGNAKPEQFAARRGIDGLKVENDYTRVLVDAVAWGPDRRARTRPIRKWTALVEQFGVRTYQGDAGELIRLLKRPVGIKKVGQHGISHGGYNYVARWAGDRDNDPRNELPYPSLRKGFMPKNSDVQVWVDDDDVRMVDVRTLKGRSLGTAISNILGAEYKRPVSRFELDIRTELERSEMEAATASRVDSTTDIRQTNQRLAPKAVAKSIAHINHILARHAETAGLTPKRATRQRTPKAAQAPAVQDPKAVLTFAKRAGTYAAPEVRLRAVPRPSPASDPASSSATGRIGATGDPS